MLNNYVGQEKFCVLFKFDVSNTSKDGYYVSGGFKMKIEKLYDFIGNEYEIAPDTQSNKLPKNIILKGSRVYPGANRREQHL